MPLPEPRNEENKSTFIERCMSDNVMIEDFEDEGQRLAVCGYNGKKDNNRSFLVFAEPKEQRLLQRANLPKTLIRI